MKKGLQIDDGLGPVDHAGHAGSKIAL